VTVHDPGSILPNFVIAGCPKCGTTAVYRWLQSHPDAGTPATKEPFYLRDKGYLGDPTSESRRDTFLDAGTEGYVELFRPAAGARLRFEATTHYFYQRLAPEVLFELQTRPKVLVMVRQPSDRLYSWYSFNKNHLASIDPDLRFAEIVDAVLSGRPENLRRRCRFEATYRSFRDGVRHGEYVHFLGAWRHFGLGERLRVEALEEVAGNERRFVQSLAPWLGLDPAFYDDARIEAVGVGYRTRFPRLHHFARSVAARLRGGGRARRALVKLYRELQVDRDGGRAVSEADRAALARLDEHYELPNQRLAEALNRPELVELWRRAR
jgi:hypothetical protein